MSEIVPYVPTLAVVMIVKDEAHTIARTLASVRPHVDRWLVLDTGSTDGTQNAVREAMAGVPGELHAGPFVDFSQALNLALDLLGAQTTHAIMLNADDELVSGESLRSLLGANERGTCFSLVHRWGANGASEVIERQTIVRTGAGWRWTRRVHEVMRHQTEQTVFLPGPWVRHNVCALGQAKSRARFARDVVWLREMLAEDPTDSRSVYYLGRTLIALGKYEEGCAFFRRRLTMGGNSTELLHAQTVLYHQQLCAVTGLPFETRWSDEPAAFTQAAATIGPLPC